MAQNQGSDHGEGQQPADFQTVLSAELQAIQCSRAVRHLEGSCELQPGAEQPHQTDVIEAAHRARLVGLALSGGGIRSATFNLGVLQAFAELKLLHLFDYLSTVSGGGYIGSWLAARIRGSSGGPANRHVPGVTMKHEIPPTPLSKGEQGHTKPAGKRTAQQDGSARTGETEAGIFSVESELAAQPCEHGPAVEPQTVRFLRRYSNYLTPRIGLFGADTGTIVSTYTRNLILNLVILIGVLAAILILPRLLVWVSAVYHGAARAALLPALMFLVLGCLFIGKNVSALARRRDYQTTKAYAVYSSQMGIQLLIVLPLFLAAWFSICWLQFENGIEQSWWLYWALFAGCAYCVIWIIIWLVGFGIPKGLDWATLLLSAFGAGAVAGILILQLVRIVLVVPVEKSGQFLVEPWAWWINATWGPPMVVLIFALTGALQIGLMGRDFRDEIREWWSRLGGLMLIYVLVWAVFFWMTIYSPKYLLSTGPWLNPIKAALGSGWLLSTIGAIIAGKSPRTGPAESNHWMEILLKIAPYVFAIGLVACLAVGIHIVLPPLISPNEATFAQIFQAIQSDQWGDAYGWHWNWLNSALNWKLLVCLAGLFLIALLFSWRVDLNEFSTHLLYRNRLIRCYLGGSRNERDPDPFTGFDADDDFPLAELAPSQTIAANSGYSGPYSIINAALNLVGGKELGWQERKARPFIFTPLFCGYDVEDRGADTQSQKPALQSAAYRPTTQYASGEGESGSGGATPGITLGTAMAISGAAASPNMGFHSSRPLAFLMTVFNVRLGWWLGNPRHRQTWNQAGPKFGLFYLLNELFGLTSDESRYVYLSDGGHFENLGIYELVRRRCRFIVCCDATGDPEMTFADLGNAIRKCSADFSIDIELDLSPIRCSPESHRSLWHCAVGAIHYERVDPNAFPGTLVYIKASLTGDEAADILNYAAMKPHFPHQSTADQWFEESQFESYRKLGNHIARTVFKPALDAASAGGDKVNSEALFVKLRQHWYPKLCAPEHLFSSHSRVLMQIYEKIRRDANLGFLDAQVFPEWLKLTENAEPKQPPVSADEKLEKLWLPKNYDEIRAGFYICNQMIQLMENVYLELKLEQEYDHPDTRGWMNLFKHWSWSGMFRVTWAISAGTYGLRFQSFCQRRLGLTLGKVIAQELQLPPEAKERGITSIEELQATGNATDLNFEELRLIRIFLENLNTPRERTAASNGSSPETVVFPAVNKILLFQLVVENPEALQNANARAGKRQRSFQFTFGFVLIHATDEADELLYFRVQDHLLKMGLARKAVKAMLEQSAQERRRGKKRTVRLNAEPLREMLLAKTAQRVPRKDLVPARELADEKGLEWLRQLFESVQLELGAKYDR